MIFNNLLFAPVLVAALHTLVVCGFVPARPSNTTLQNFDTVTTSRLGLQWYKNGSDQLPLSRELASAGANGLSQGILVHFSEEYTTNETSITPWVALVTCDVNSTDSSREVDIFTMAKDFGAQAAVLYSLYSETCTLNAEYLNIANSKRGFDIFTTLAVQASRRIEHDFNQIQPSYATYYNATMLNDAATKINLFTTTEEQVPPGFLVATLRALHDTGTAPVISRLQAETNATTTTQPSSQTGIAMVVLYAITGFVSALFCVVVVSGAIKAIRHPERYGPRSDPAQSRARGLGRAILDTFPVVKFRPTTDDRESGLSNPKDVESSSATIAPSGSAVSPNSLELREIDGVPDEHGHEYQRGETSVVAGSGFGKQVSTDVDPDTQMPERIGRETCPICIVDFEEGDDLRVLPCEGNHRFHQSCVDPWLLELSGSCPICRQDFHALETIISGEPEGTVANHEGQGSSSMTQGRLSRYLRFARMRQQRRGSRPGP